MAIRLSHLKRDWDVQAARVADQGDIRLGIESLIEFVVDFDMILLLDIRSCLDVQLVGHDMRGPSHAVGRDLQLVAEQRVQVAEMTLADAAQADHQDLHDVTPFVDFARPAERSCPTSQARFCAAQFTSSRCSPRATCRM